MRFEPRIETGGVTLRARDVDVASRLGGLEAADQAGRLAPAQSGATMSGEAATFELTRDRFDTQLGSSFLGAVLSRQMGLPSLSDAATAGWSEVDAHRVARPLAPGLARSERGAPSLGLPARAVWAEILDGGAPLKLSLDLALIHRASEDFSGTASGSTSAARAPRATAMSVIPAGWA